MLHSRLLGLLPSQTRWQERHKSRAPKRQLHHCVSALVQLYRPLKLTSAFTAPALEPSVASSSKLAHYGDLPSSLQVREAAGRGRGVFAKSSITPGKLLCWRRATPVAARADHALFDLRRDDRDLDRSPRLCAGQQNPFLTLQRLLYCRGRPAARQGALPVLSLPCTSLLLLGAPHDPALALRG